MEAESERATIREPPRPVLKPASPGALAPSERRRAYYVCLWDVTVVKGPGAKNRGSGRMHHRERESYARRVVYTPPAWG